MIEAHYELHAECEKKGCGRADDFSSWGHNGHIRQAKAAGWAVYEKDNLIYCLCPAHAHLEEEMVKTLEAGKKWTGKLSPDDLIYFPSALTRQEVKSILAVLKDGELKDKLRKALKG